MPASHNPRIRATLQRCLTLLLASMVFLAGLVCVFSLWLGGWLDVSHAKSGWVDAWPAVLVCAALLLVLALGIAALRRWILSPMHTYANALRQVAEHTTIALDLPQIPFVELAAVGAAAANQQRRAATAVSAVEAAKRQLGAALTERDRQLARQTDELRSALTAANDAILARDSLLANTSHEIRTPLYGIIGSAELMRLRLSGIEDVRDTDAILRSAEHLLQLINDLLDFSRINAGKLELAAQAFSVADEVQAAITAVQLVAEQRKLRVDFHNGLATRDRRIGDALRVRQIVLNLISNAIKFTEQGGVTINLGETEEGRVRLSVADTGVGISAEDQGRIFQPFEQADSSASRRFQGSGLGLAIIDRLVALMDGSIALESAIGKGTRFTIELALERIVDAPIKVKPVPALAKADHAGLRVLVVDDVDINRGLLVAQLQRLGTKPIAAGDGFEALKILAAQSFDLILLDIQMPGIDGYETAERMRLLPNAREARIVAVTANAQSSEREHCLAAGMNDYVSKPVRLQTLQRVLLETVSSNLSAIGH